MGIDLNEQHYVRSKSKNILTILNLAQWLRLNSLVSRSVGDWWSKDLVQFDENLLVFVQKKENLRKEEKLPNCV